MRIFKDLKNPLVNITLEIWKIMGCNTFLKKKSRGFQNFIGTISWLMFYRGIRVEAFYESGLKDEVKFTLIHNYQNDYTNHSEINNLVRIKSIII